MKPLIVWVICAVAFLGPVATRAEAAGGTVEGTVTPVAFAQETEVCVVGLASPESCVVPRADGSYVFGRVPVEKFKIEFLPTYRSRRLTQYYDHKSTSAEATLLEVPELVTRKDVDADLVEGGAITGDVTAAAGGEGLSEVEACAVSIGSPTVKSCAETDPGGAYELHSLPTGTYRVGFWGLGKSAGYQSSYYPGGASSAAATPIAVTAGETTAGVDIALGRGAQIEGQVTAAAGGAPLDGVSVCLFSAASATAERCTESGEGGSYSFRGLADGPYQVGFSLEATEVSPAGSVADADGFESQYFDGVAARAQAATIPLFAPETLDGVDAALVGSSTPPAAAAPTIDAPIPVATPRIAEPEPKKAGCKKPRRQKKVKGRVRCVKPAKHRKGHRSHKQKKAPRGKRD